MLKLRPCHDVWIIWIIIDAPKLSPVVMIDWIAPVVVIGFLSTLLMTATYYNPLVEMLRHGNDAGFGPQLDWTQAPA